MLQFKNVHVQRINNNDVKLQMLIKDGSVIIVALTCWKMLFFVDYGHGI